MASVAATLKERGFAVTGSDQGIYPPMSTFLEERGIEVRPLLLGSPNWCGLVETRHISNVNAMQRIDCGDTCSKMLKSISEI